MFARRFACIVLAAPLLAACGGSTHGAPVHGRPSDRVLTFATERDYESNIYTLDVVSGEVRVLVENAHGPEWSPDGKTLAFVRGGDISLRDGDAYLRAVPAGQARLLARNSGPAAWSADARSVLVDGIDRLETEGDGRDHLVDGQEPVPSPDGSRIAFRRGDSPVPPEVWVSDVDGHDASELKGVRTCSSLAWSPDGSHLALVDDTDATGSAYSGHLTVVDAKTGSARRATARSVNCDPPLWSRQGKLAVTVDSAGGDIEPFVVGATPRVAARLRTLHGFVKPLAWSPTGRWLALGGEDLVLVDTRTGAVKRPTRAAQFGYEIIAARWNPTATRISEVGGTPAALGNVSTTSVAGSNTLDTQDAIASMAADGTTLAVVYANADNCVELWNARTRSLTRIDDDSCLGIDNQAIDAIAVGGGRAVWVDSMETLHYDLGVETATAAAPVPRGVFGDQDAWGHGGVAAAGRLAVYVRWRSRTSDVLRVTGRGVRKLRTEPGRATILDVDAGLVALREPGRVRILSASGSVVADLATRATAARLDGDQLAVFERGSVTVYDVRTRAVTQRLSLQGQAALAGFARGVIAYRGRGSVGLVRLADGRRAKIPVPYGGGIHAELTSAGLFYSVPRAGGAHVVFKLFAQLLR